MGSELQVRMVVEADEPFDYPVFVVRIDNNKGQRMLSLRSPRSDLAIPRIWGRNELTCRVGQLPLAPGDYTVRVSLCRGFDEVEAVEGEIPFTIRNADTFGDGWGARRGLCVAPSSWNLAEVENGAKARLRA
jgi:hypothetical protein